MAIQPEIEVQTLYLIAFEERAFPPPPYIDLLPLFYNQLNATPLFEVKNIWLVRSPKSASSLLEDVRGVLHVDDGIIILPIGGLVRGSTFASQGLEADIELL